MNSRPLALCLLLVLALCRRHLNRNEPSPVEAKTVIESNHYYSETQTETTEQINNLIKNEALLFMLKDTDGKTDSMLQENPIKIQLASN